MAGSASIADAGAAGGGEGAWRAYARAFVLTLALVLAAYLALAVLLDPYDSGRVRVFSMGAVRPQGPRTAAAMRGRDPAFRAAILGNSHIQLIEPTRLSAQAGIPFVQLSVPATGPGEQLALAGWFLRHHPAPDALVFAPDESWCTDDPGLPEEKPFPHWLFAQSPASYLRGLLRWSVLEEVLDRIGWLVRRNRPHAARDGWWDYERDYLALGYPDAPGLPGRHVAAAPETPDPGRAGPDFPAAGRLAAFARGLPEATALVLVLPPIRPEALPRAGTPRAAAEAACKAALARALVEHPRSAVLDWRRDRPELHAPDLFFDRSHYRHALAHPVTADIADALRRLAAGPPNR